MRHHRSYSVDCLWVYIWHGFQVNLQLGFYPVTIYIHKALHLCKCFYHWVSTCVSCSDTFALASFTLHSQIVLDVCYNMYWLPLHWHMNLLMSGRMPLSSGIISAPFGSLYYFMPISFIALFFGHKVPKAVNGDPKLCQTESIIHSGYLGGYGRHVLTLADIKPFLPANLLSLPRETVFCYIDHTNTPEQYEKCGNVSLAIPLSDLVDLLPVANMRHIAILHSIPVGSRASYKLLNTHYTFSRAQLFGLLFL